MRKIICWLIGHAQCWPWADLDDEAHYCERCGASNAPDSVCAELVGRIKHRWHWRVGIWLERCPDCGLRFKRHDEAVEHGPF